MSTVVERRPERAPQPPVVLGDADFADVVKFVDRDPLVNAVLASRLQAVGCIETARFGGTLFGVRAASGELLSAAYVGAVLLPAGGSPDEWHVLAAEIARRPRSATSIVGRAPAVNAMWTALAPRWGPARVLRPVQYLVALDSAAALPTGDPRVRRVRSEDLDAYVPAAAAMFTEELGISPYDLGSTGGYRRRVTALVDAGHSFAVFDDDGSVLFKADIGIVSAHTCQLQGVWVRPDMRGRGLGTGALSAVVRQALQLAPTVSLYVNDFNTAARRMYARLGMRSVATLASVLF